MAILTAESKKITVTIPVALLNRLDDHVSKRQRSDFIAEAIAEHLALAEQAAAIDEAVGIWADADHPELADGEAIDRWVSAMRQNWYLPTEERVINGDIAT